MGIEWLGMPMFVILIGAILTLMMTAFARHHQYTPKIVAALSLASVVGAFLLSWFNWLGNPFLPLGMIEFDRISLVAWLIILLSSAMVILLSIAYLPQGRRVQAEYFPLILFSVFGMGILTTATNLITIVIGIEITSLAAYTLVGLVRYKARCNEAALKYFLMGTFALAFLILGLAFIFGSANTAYLGEIGEGSRAILASDKGWLFIFGSCMVMIGLAFKVAAVPFHAWAPDVYDGAPTPITAFIASAVKVAAFVALIRLGIEIFGKMGTLWITISYTVAVLTMLLGNLAAIAQENMKRLLAYSSIAHVGYMLVAFPSFARAENDAAAAVLFYLIAYSVMTIGAFAVLVALSEGHEEHNNISSLSGLGKRRPGMAAALTLFLVSLAGFPPTFGFFAKYFLFLSAVRSGFVWLVVIAVINSTIAIYYYLRPVVVMYLHDEKTISPHAAEHTSSPISTSVLAVIFICALMVAFFGIFPTNLLDLTLQSISIAR